MSSVTAIPSLGFARGAIVRPRAGGPYMLVVRGLGETTAVVVVEGDAAGQVRLREVPTADLEQILPPVSPATNRPGPLPESGAPPPCPEVLINGHLIINVGDLADLLGGLEAVPFDEAGFLRQRLKRQPDEEVRVSCLCPVDMDAVAARLGGTVNRSDPKWWEIVLAADTAQPARQDTGDTA